MAILTYARGLNKTTFSALCAAFAQDAFQYCLRWDDFSINLEQFGKDADWVESANGRIWGETSDLQWRCRDGLYHCVLINDEENIPDDFPQNVRHLLPTASHVYKVYLWGEHDQIEHRWIEIKVPQLFDYSDLLAGQPARVRLTVYEYDLEDERTLWEFGQPVTVPVASKVYRYGKIIGEN